MTVSRRLVPTLALVAGGALLAPNTAQAMNIFVAKLDFATTSESMEQLFVVVDNDPADEVASVELKVSSDGGDEDLVLTESDAWLHGSAALSSWPTKETTLVLICHNGEGTMANYSGKLAPDGTVSFGTAESACESSSKAGCASTPQLDLAVLSAEAFPSGKGYALTLDLVGADAYEVTHATVEIAGGEKAEVSWGAVGSVWQAEATLEHTGVIDVKAKALDAAGHTLENVRSELAEPWGDGGDGGDGVNALSAGSATSVALARISHSPARSS